MELVDVFYTILLVAVIIIVTFLITKLVRFVIRGMTRTEAPLLATYMERIAVIIIWIVGILIAVETVGLRIDLILLLLALAGIACIVGFKDVLQNLTAKYFNDLYIPMKLGDEISVRGDRGKIIGINSLSTIILDEEEQITSIPNAIFMREPVINLTQAAWKKIIIPIIVSPDIDLPEFESAVLRACNKLKMYWDEHFPPLLMIKSRDASNLRLELELMVNNPDKKEKVSAEINAKIMEILLEFQKKKT
jgi:small-conductance mechanosensitive channel